MLNDKKMKTMKKYIKPQIQVIPLNCQQSILAGSGEKGTTMYNSGFDSSKDALSREFDDDFDWDEE
jgi:hypothetical protein